MKHLFKSYSVLFLLTILLSPQLKAQTGGQFSITQSVTANGGGKSDAGNFSVAGTSGQPVSGTDSAGGQFAVHGGFWQQFILLLAANVTVGGRVTTATGGGIANARVTLTGLSGASQSAVTNSFGYFRFPEVPSGETYIVGVTSREFQFANPTQIVFAAGDISDIIFIADLEER